MIVVVDASVAAKWYLPEKGSDAAVELQEGQDELVAPDLIRMEVAGSITRRGRAEKKEDRLTPAAARSRCDKWFRLLDTGVLTLIPDAELLQQAVALSIEIKHTLPDCLYLAVAQREKAHLVTADKPFHDRATGFYREISLLRGCEGH